MKTGRVIGLLTGSGTHRDPTIERLKEAGYEPVIVHIAGGAGPTGVAIRLGKIDRIIRYLNNRGVKEVAHIGDVSLMHEDAEGYIGSSQTLAPNEMEKFIVGDNTIEEILQKAAYLFGKSGIQPVHLKDLVPCFSIDKEGWIAPPPPRIEVQINALAERVSREIASEINRYGRPQELRRTIVLEEGTGLDIRREAHTHKVLSEIRMTRKKPGHLRTLIKVGSNLGQDCTLEAPVFHPDLVYACKESEIDLVVLNSSQGVITQRDVVAQKAAEAGIAVWTIRQPLVAVAREPGNQSDP
ncbi:hypothetical protein [uncultured Litoreibacter sp.]|uniref:hypothetical protein n=1 Tax=uncultured Litoreibacter sp. TaxID=1392394 RepID=UPI00262D4509|nr:hypothetical protein [uncultured Litoreibacter sp.]